MNSNKSENPSPFQHAHPVIADLTRNPEVKGRARPSYWL